jgi:hypothetical protein
MHSKINNNKTKTYLQGLRLFSRSLPKGAKNILKKNGYNYSEIISKWSSLMNKNIANSAYPKSIKINLGNENATLVLAVKRGNEVLIEYSKKEIIDKINTYFGYNFLCGVRLESINSETKIKKNKKKLDVFSEKIEKKIKQIKNQNIQKAFFELINEIKKT